MLRDLIGRLCRPAVLRGSVALTRVAFPAVLALLGAQRVAMAEQPDRVSLKIVGGFGSVAQYTELEQRFWTSEIAALSGGRIRASIQPQDTTGWTPPEVLRLLKLGVTPFATLMTATLEGDDPELNIIDLPGTNPDIATLRRSVADRRGHLSAILAQRYGVELLGIYVYSAQVVFCATSFSGLEGLGDRRVRTASVGQSDLVRALGAVPVKLPFSAIVDAMRRGAIDCAITGAQSGHDVGLADVTSHIHAMPVSWGVTFFAAHRPTWAALPADLREIVRSGVADLERRIWARAELDTLVGLACSANADPCPPPRRRSMTVVRASAADRDHLARIVARAIVPHWLERCGQGCAAAWNRHSTSPGSVAVRTD